jgi:hypothetical protein
LIVAKNHPRKGAILLFCEFKIIPDEMANNGPFGFLVLPAAIIPFCFALEN